MQSVLDAFRRCVAEAIAGDRDYSEQFIIVGRPDLWLQLSWDYFNLALPHESVPELGTIPNGVGIEALEPRKFLTLSHSADDAEVLCDFLIKAAEACWQVAIGPDALVKVQEREHRV